MKCLAIDSGTAMLRLLLTGLIVSSISLIVSMACTAPATAPTPPAPAPLLPPTSPPPTKWSADGVIAAGEYTKTKTYGDYEINWATDGKYVYLGLKAKTTGWLAIGIQPGSTMKDADMVFCFVKDGKATVYDHFSTGSYGPHSSDSELGGKNDILEYAGKEDGGYTIIEFKRALSTDDKYDKPLSKGTNKIIWAYGSDDEPTLKHIIRGYGEIDL